MKNRQREKKTQCGDRHPDFAHGDGEGEKGRTSRFSLFRNGWKRGGKKGGDSVDLKEKKKG